jgi:hypothetical protein
LAIRAKSGLQNAFHSVTMASASAPTSASFASSHQHQVVALAEDAPASCIASGS